MTSSDTYNDQIPTDPRTLLLAILTCALLAGLIPPDRAEALVGLLAITLPLLVSGRR